jgi:uracil-DNA glycosylase family 4
MHVSDVHAGPPFAAEIAAVVAREAHEYAPDVFVVSGDFVQRADELAQCRHFLNRQIELLQPRVILALGRLASMAVLHDSLPDVGAVPLGKLRGKVHHVHGRPVIVSYHPAYLMRTPSDKAKAWSDLCLAMQQLRNSGA